METTRGDRIVPAGTLTGDPVRSRSGDDLGTIDDLIVDVETGQVVYVVLAAGGFLGFGEKYFPIPWSALTVDLSSQEFILNGDKETLERAPAFNKEQWLGPGDRSWTRRIHEFLSGDAFWRKPARPKTFVGGKS